MKTLKRLGAAAAAVVIGFVFGALDARAAEPIAYLDWNPETRQLEERTVTEYTVIDENWTPTELNGWYVVDGEVVDKGSLSVNGEAHIILKDGSGLYLQTAGLHVGASGSTTNAVTIYGQQEATGVLVAWGASYCAAIGGQSDEDCGRVTINGGRITAARGSSASGIGGGYQGAGGTVTINGGTLNVPSATDYRYGSGIGGGRRGAGGTVTVNGGRVTVYGGSSAAGIGGGQGGVGGAFVMNGGWVTVYGGYNAAGIGGGAGGVGGAFVMNGGWVKSTGSGAAGIGSGSSVTGQHGDFTITPSDIAVAVASLVSSMYSPVMTNATAMSYAVSRDNQVCLWQRKFTGPVAYMDWDESSKTLVERTVESCMIVDADTPFVRLEGWCVVEGVVSNASLAAGTDARLILKDESLLVLNPTDETYAPGFLVDVDESNVNSLCVYGQSAGTGRLCAYGGKFSAGIGGAWSSRDDYKTCGTVTICGGTINAHGQGQGAGIGGAYSGDGGTVTINGGRVVASSGGYCAGIGGGENGAGGTVTINGGEVTATGLYGAGIGGGLRGTGGTVTINGGEVTATGYEGAGIGGGQKGAGGTVTINGGKVTATAASGSYGTGAGIGGGSRGDGGDVTINGGEVTVISDNGAGIGGGSTGKGGTVVISNGTVTVKSAYGAGIGAGYNQTEHGSLLAWDGFTVASSSGDAPLAVTTFDEYQTNRLGNVCFWKMNTVSDVPYWAWDESAGELVERTAASCVLIDEAWVQTALTGWYVVGGDVALSNLVAIGEVHLILKDGVKLSVGSAKASEPAVKVVRQGETVNSLAVYGQEAGTGRLDAMTSLGNCVGIGGSWREECGRVTIHGGIVTATGYEYGAGIGNGKGIGGGEVTVNGGTVTAQGGRLAAGIGGGYQGGGGTLVVNGGVVTATGGDSAAGIGGGCEGGGGQVTINGGTVAATGASNGAGIGGGYYRAGGTVTINGGKVTAIGNYGAGIGGGIHGDGGQVTINGGTVIAAGGQDAPGIGRGAYGWDHKSLTIAEPLMVIAGATATTAVEMPADDYIYWRYGYVKVAPKVIPQQTIATGAYLSLDLVKVLGIEIPEDVDYAAGDKVTVKIEGLAKGLKLVTTQLKETTGKKAVTNVVYAIEGVPTETVDFDTQTMYARVTVTYKDKTKGDKGKIETLQPIPLSVVPAKVRTLAAGVLNEVYEPVDIAELWPEVKDAKVNPTEWSFKGWPAGIKYNNKATDVNWSYKSPDGKSYGAIAVPYAVYGQPTKAGVFPITATWKHKLEDNKTTVSETFSAVLTVWGSEGEKDFRYTARAYGAPVDVTIADAKSVSGLPTGIKHDKETGKVTGTPTKPGDFVVTVTKKDDEKETFIWNVAPPDAPEFELDPGTAPVENLKVQIVQGANQSFAITATAGAKVTASGLPSGLKLVQDKTTGLYSVEGVATKPGEYVVTFKTVLNKVTTVTTTAFTVKGNPFTATYRGYLTARPADGAEKRLAIAEVTVAAAGTVKLTYTEGKTKYTASVKSYDWDDTTGKGTVEGLVLKVSSADRQLGYGDRKATLTFEDCGAYLDAKLDVKDANGIGLSSGASLLYATVKTTGTVRLPVSQTFVFRTEDGADTNALATVSLAYDASKATAAFSGKLYDGTAVKATVPVLRWDDEGTPKEGTSDDYVFAPFLVIAKDGTVYRFERFSSAEDGGFICWVGEDGESGEEAGSANADFTPCDKRFAELVSETGSFAFGWGSDAETVGADAEEFAFEVTKDKEGKPKGVAIYDADRQTNEKPLVTVAAKVGKKTGAISVSFTSKKGAKAKYAVELVWRDDQLFAGHVMRTWKGVDPVANKPVNLSASGTAEVTAGAGDDYLVIDLSGGPSAASYPVSYLDAEPQGGWTDEYKTGKLVLRKIQPGTFTMGCETTEIGYNGYEAVPHPVTISRPFYMGVFQVTQRQWELVMGTKPSYFSNATYYKTRPVENVSWNMIRGDSSTYNWPNVKTVDPATFIGKLRAKAGLEGIDLPTEAQWEYACRAGTTTAFNSGKNPTSEESDANMNEVGRYGYNSGFSPNRNYSSSSTASQGTAAVGSYKPNDWGLYDMHGNVWEWCLDWYTSRSGFTSAAVTDPFGPASGSYRVLRGGSWRNIAQNCRSAYRGCSDPSNYDGSGGFRLSRTLP